jgi:hypothetical protein
MNEMYFLGMLFAIPPWSMFFDDPRKKLPGLIVQICGLTLLIGQILILTR